ncbi:hypothetical protein SCHPADRAFT_911953 [Schizopora paradoxa]|uniref:Uncharacterized protein n=1 Tax=Schizopora paradoxa TaxID=27342 RepID=A0A0H2RG34_9AGAM|nr:hypothetical protein SCHPADRAFT_911953 [Schizopora paradoxa]
MPSFVAHPARRHRCLANLLCLQRRHHLEAARSRYLRRPSCRLHSSTKTNTLTIHFTAPSSITPAGQRADYCCTNDSRLQSIRLRRMPR